MFADYTLPLRHFIPLVIDLNLRGLVAVVAGDVQAELDLVTKWIIVNEGNEKGVDVWTEFNEGQEGSMICVRKLQRSLDLPFSLLPLGNIGVE